MSVSTLSVDSTAIPKEYHKKILKKIAQLTKVIHSLHSKIDDHEDEVNLLIREHEAKLKSISEEKDNQLKLLEEQKTISTKLQTDLSSLEVEKDKLIKDHSDYVNDVEAQLQSIKSKHFEQQKKSSETLSEVECRLAEGEKRHQELMKKNQDITKQWEKLKKKSAEELDLLERNHNNTVLEYIAKLEESQKKHEQEMIELKEQQEQELISVKQSLSNKALLENEIKKHKDEYQSLLDKSKDIEHNTSQTISKLSSELCQVKDKLALAEEKNRKMEKEIYEKDKDGDTVLSKLKEKEEKIGQLVKQVQELKEKETIATERYKQQKDETKKIRVHNSELEALCIANERSISDLQSKLHTYSEQLHLQQEQSKELEKKHKTTSNEQLKILEKELEKQLKEKKELRAEFARELEAARSQLSDKEIHLAKEHLKILHQLKDKHRQELETINKANQDELASLQSQLNDQKSSELRTLADKYNKQIAILSSSLSEKTDTLTHLKHSLDDVSSKFVEKEKLTEHLTSCVTQLRHEITSYNLKLTTLQRDRDSYKSEANQLKLSIEEMKNKMSQRVSEHETELRNAKQLIKEEIENQWMTKLKNELDLLQKDLDEQHKEMHSSAINKLVEINENDFKRAEETWSNEKQKLLEKINSLNTNISNLQQSYETEISQNESQAEYQLNELKKELKNTQMKSDEIVNQLKVKQAKEINLLKESFGIEQKKLANDLMESHKKELLQLHQTQILTISTLRSEMNQEKDKALCELNEQHHQKIRMLEDKLSHDYQVTLSDIQSQYEHQLEQKEKEQEKKLTKLNNEIMSQKTKIDGLSSEVTQCRRLLLKERDKVDKLTIELNSAKKNLELKANEIISIKNETTKQLRLKEENLLAVHRAELETLVTEQRYHTQTLLNDFNTAKQILTSKLQETEKRLHEAEIRYRNREPRQEDIDCIRELRKVVNEQGLKLKEILAEKKVYEMELVNREKNYNKIFNATPLIGVLDPLHVKKHVSSSVASGQSSIASIISIEDSLPQLINSSSSIRTNSITKIKDRSSLQEHRKIKFLSDTTIPRDMSKSKEQTTTQHSKTLVNGNKKIVASTSEMIHVAN